MRVTDSPYLFKQSILGFTFTSQPGKKISQGSFNMHFYIKQSKTSLQRHLFFSALYLSFASIFNELQEFYLFVKFLHLLTTLQYFLPFMFLPLPYRVKFFCFALLWFSEADIYKINFLNNKISMFLGLCHTSSKYNERFPDKT